MKKAIAIIILGLLWCNVEFAGSYNAEVRHKDKPELGYGFFGWDGEKQEVG